MKPGSNPPAPGYGLSVPTVATRPKKMCSAGTSASTRRDPTSVRRIREVSLGSSTFDGPGPGCNGQPGITAAGEVGVDEEGLVRDENATFAAWRSRWQIPC